MVPRPVLTVVLTTALLAAPLAAKAQTAGKIARVGVLASSTADNFEPSVKAFREALHAAGWVEGRNQPAELPAAFDTMRRDRTDALVLAADPVLFSEKRRIIELAARDRLPAVYETRNFPEGGGLLSYGPLTQERFQRMAVYVDRILRGARPGELPVEQPTTFELVINLKTVKALGLTIPPSVLARANAVIE